MSYLLAIDQSTTATKVHVLDRELNELASAAVPFEQHYPHPGWVEHDPEEIWSTLLRALQQVERKVPLSKITAIGITNQRETVCFWDRKTLKPFARAIVWQDRRTAAQCQSLRESGHEEFFRSRTGLLLDPYFSGTKISWALQNWPEVKTAALQGRLAVGTIDSYLIARMTAGKSHVTEASNASRTLLFNIQNLKWDSELCKILKVEQSLLPEVRASAGAFGTTAGLGGIKDGTPISGALGDQQAALLGQACLTPGSAKCTYGTGAFLLMNTGNEVVMSRHRLLSTVAWTLPGQSTQYALEGSAFIAGAAVQWLRDGLKLIKNAAEIEDLALRVSSTEGVVFVPALTGLGAPHWDPHATGLFTGLTRGTTTAHLARAVLEGIAFQNYDLLVAMQKDLGKPLTSLNVDGGASANSMLMQFQSDLLNTRLIRPKVLDTTVVGAAFAAGLGAGIWKSQEDIRQAWKKDREFSPHMSDLQRQEALKRWHVATRQAMTHES